MLINFLIKKLRDKKNQLVKEYELFNYAKKHKCKLGQNLNLTGNLKNLNIGEGTTINGYANFRFSKGKISIGKNCLLARNITIITQAYKLDERKEITSKDMFNKDVVIGDGVWIGSNVTIMPGVKIGDYSVIGAGSILTKEVAKYEIWAGNPAKKIRNRQIINE